MELHMIQQNTVGFVFFVILLIIIINVFATIPQKHNKPTEFGIFLKVRNFHKKIWTKKVFKHLP